MSNIEFSEGNLPSVEEFVRRLQEAKLQYDPVDKLLALERELAALEQQHHIASDEFFRRYQVGEMGDATEYVRWAGRYRLYQNLKEMILTPSRRWYTPSSQTYL